MAVKNKKQKRKICFVITSFIHYSRNFLVLEELQKRNDVELHVIVAGTALLSKYSARSQHIQGMLKKKGIKRVYEIYFNLEGGKPVVKAKTAGLGMVEFSSVFNQVNPDVVVVRGDRFEVLSATAAAALMNISIAHIEGGDVTGTIDESVRHAITKFAHIHFATNKDAKRRVLQMGENPKYVFNFGSPDVEVVKKLAKKTKKLPHISQTGSGAMIDPNKDFIMVSYHPVTSELDKLSEHTDQLLEAVHTLGIPTFWFWPNADAGAEEKISHRLRIFNDTHKNHNIRFMRYLPPEQYLWFLGRAKCMVGNSSAGIKECSYLGVPVVNIGTRQQKRLKAKNVLNVSHSTRSIKTGIQKQLKRGKYKSSNVYSVSNTSKNIAKTLATTDLYIQKLFNG